MAKKTTLDKDWETYEKDGKIIYINKITKKRKVITVNKEPTKTDQSYKKQCDASYIVQKYATTGQLTHVATRQGQFADVSGVQDLLPSMLVVEKAKTEFMSLPADIRRKFDNSPDKFIEFLADPKNDEQAVELGLKVAPNLDSGENNDAGGVSNPNKGVKSESGGQTKNSGTKGKDNVSTDTN